MLAAPGRVTSREEFAGMMMAGASGAAGAVKDTPVVVHPAWAVSAVAAPVEATEYS
jgi:hypothetical protein